METINGREVITGRELIAKYKITHNRLTQLVFENKLFPIRGAINLLYNATQVHRYFTKQQHIEGLPKIISAHDVLNKYKASHKLTRAEMAKLVSTGKLIPLPFKHEPNMHFEYLAVTEYFDNQK